MVSAIFSALHPHFSSLLHLLRADAVKGVKEALKAAGSGKGGDAFSAAAERARAEAVAAFEAAAAEAQPAAGAEEWAAAAGQARGKAVRDIDEAVSGERARLCDAAVASEEKRVRFPGAGCCPCPGGERTIPSHPRPRL